MPVTLSAPLPVHALFDFDDSDITLQSSDGVRFRVHKGRLSANSLFFKDIFDGGLGQAAGAADVPQLQEPAATLAVLFAMCYPFDPDDAPFDLVGMDPALLMSCYEASEKYTMWVAQQIIPLVAKDPFRLVRTGYVLRKQSLLSAAARATLDHDIIDSQSQYQEKAGNTWPALLAYHMAYGRKVAETLYGMSCNLGPRDMEWDTDVLSQKYACNSYSGRSCGEMEIVGVQWQNLRHRLDTRLTPRWPAAELLSFINQQLESVTTRKCSGCTCTWKEMHKRATTLEPSLTLTLEQIDRSLSVPPQTTSSLT
ncbi:hypothetical protein AURDEDRAFT_185954 [Auricularia subglabra TFB-10046 SS5]|nr:hypothetical protein AURDEDRAFT_185954 [Auricularia subglabra TFB-10046 SS5]